MTPARHRSRVGREAHERALDEMTAAIFRAREKYPHQTVHAASIRTTNGVSQLTVGRWVPAKEVRATLEAQLALVNAREGS